jgi:REP element-mobilizing transposase RayT
MECAELADYDVRMNWARSTYFLTTSTSNRRLLLQSTHFAELFIDCLLLHRDHHQFDLHVFVVMPDHVHLLLTPGDEVTLERAVQFVKGTFSFRLKRELGYGREVWSSKYHDERIRSAQYCYEVMEYIERNPSSSRAFRVAGGVPVWIGIIALDDEYSAPGAKATSHRIDVFGRLKPAATSRQKRRR